QPRGRGRYGAGRASADADVEPAVGRDRHALAPPHDHGGRRRLEDRRPLGTVAPGARVHLVAGHPDPAPDPAPAAARAPARPPRGAAAVLRPTSPRWQRRSSYLRSVASMPQADSTAATAGTTTRRISRSRATSVTCSPAAPPNATSAKRRGSTPRRTETILIP